MLETTEEAPPGTSALPFCGELALVVCGARGPRAVPLRGAAPIHIGRASGCELVLADRSISRLHARFSRVTEGVLVEDMGSRHGTWVAGARVERAALGLGAAVRVGDVVIAVARASELLEVSTADPSKPCDAPASATRDVAETNELGVSLRAQLKTVEYAQVKRALELSAGNQRKAAELVGLPLRTFERRLRALRNAEAASNAS